MKKKILFILALLASYGGFVAYQRKDATQPTTPSDTGLGLIPAAPTGNVPIVPADNVQNDQPIQRPYSDDREGSGEDGAPITVPTPTPAPAPTPIPVVTAPVPTPVQAPTSVSRGAYIDGTYTSQPVDAYYGLVQIAVTVSGGKISDVNFLQYPNDRSRSVEISGYATPQLRQELIAAQNANVDIVSGATSTSEAFLQAAADVLAKAKA